MARLDFAYPELKIGIETHGYRWHGGKESWERDLKRSRDLALAGWTVLYFSWDDVHLSPERVADEVRAAVHAGA